MKYLGVYLVLLFPLSLMASAFPHLLSEESNDTDYSTRTPVPLIKKIPPSRKNYRSLHEWIDGNFPSSSSGLSDDRPWYACFLCCCCGDDD